MKEVLRKIYYSIIYFLPAKLVIYFETFRTYKKILNKNNPKYFGEKIQWLKLYGNLEKYSKYVDKYSVREFVKNKVGEEYLIPLINVYDTVDDIKYEELPDSFVLKNNNGSAMNILVKNKKNINPKKINSALKKWLKSKYYKIKKENQYKNVNNRIVCEKYIVDSNEELLDYKFFCFDGEPLFLKVDYDRFSNHTVNFYDMSWNKLNIREQGYNNYNNETYPPENFDKMVEIAKKLSEDFQFVRVDLYNVDGNIYFGELTFTPASGKNAFLPLEEDVEIAKRIKVGD